MAWQGKCQVLFDSRYNDINFRSYLSNKEKLYCFVLHTFVNKEYSKNIHKRFHTYQNKIKNGTNTKGGFANISPSSKSTGLPKRSIYRVKLPRHLYAPHRPPQQPHHSISHLYLASLHRSSPHPSPPRHSITPHTHSSSASSAHFRTFPHRFLQLFLVLLYHSCFASPFFLVCFNVIVFSEL